MTIAEKAGDLTPRELSDIKEAEAKAKREAHPEAMGILMYMSQEKGVSYADFEQLKEKVEWTEIHGAAALTRKTMWFVKKGCRCPYSYGKQQVSAVTFPDWFLDMAKRWLNSLNLNDQDKDSTFPNCVNLNLYEHGDHQVAWHSDDEPLFRGKFQDTRIISVTLGAMRKFQVGLKAPRRGGILKPEKGSMATFNLGHGQVCTMEGLFQKHYLHQIAKGTTRQARINATFRNIVEHAAGCPLR
ncbi:Alpha-ketoglutarate-dependent dioxygenase alkB homolog 3 (Alkylated DNA repair protein alkB homolog 3) (hABH3) (DEPC-1) (Prostate cancer antigen 1) [Durusdinium trenchii]|uniref:Alpha-ketoglutarate-dependent dioxygenase alkB homolog 3 (Alkylated DNA repair protein alkB homolog 3) (HABH3) (DEPC-1) (Prostate cancer antigen 1) n=1 Tax=Durusdinium trenchii TaxID=1381693 RepID=A0ABP0S032_9DINO